MLSEEEKKAIKRLKAIDETVEEYDGNILKADIKIITDLITKLQKESGHQTEKINNQKVELATLNEKQEDMSKLINDVKSYKGQFKRQEKQIRELQKENEELNKKIYLCTPEIPQCQHGKYINYSDLIDKIIIKDKKIEKKDKQIDLMGEVIFKKFAAQLVLEYGIENKEQFIKLFEEKAKEKGE